MEELQEILALLRENNSMLKEIVAYIRKVNDKDYVMEQDINDFVMNVVANLIAADMEGLNGDTVKRT